jgi:hypothetical protein
MVCTSSEKSRADQFGWARLQMKGNETMNSEGSLAWYIPDAYLPQPIVADGPYGGMRLCILNVSTVQLNFDPLKIVPCEEYPVWYAHAVRPG